MLALAGAAAASHSPAARADNSNADITDMRVERNDDGVFVTASLRIDLPALVQDALLKGIPMIFVLEAELFRDRWYWTDRRVTTAVRTLRLSHQTLTRRWRLAVGGAAGAPAAGIAQLFDTLDEALATMQRVPRWKVATSDQVEPDARHNLDLRFRLDVTQLPRPFQIGAVGQSDWSITASRNQRVLAEAAK